MTALNYFSIKKRMIDNAAIKRLFEYFGELLKILINGTQLPRKLPAEISTIH
jgi:hypothetical protein